VLLSQKLQVLVDYFMITVGSFVAAVGLGLFMVEADVVPGGVTGISMTLNFIWPDGPSVGALIWILNVPLFIWGIVELGNAFGVRTFYGFSTNAFFIDLLRGDIPYFKWLDLQNTETIQYMLKEDFFFFILVGSVFTGIGLGLVFKFKGTTAGTEIVSAILKKRFGIAPGVSMICVDFFVITAATIVLMQRDANIAPPVVLAAYALFSLYLSSVILDRVVYGFDYAKNMMIFSSKTKEISDYIIKNLDRGVTAFYARGMFTNKEREVLMTIVSPSDARVLSPFIRKVDPNAFIALSNVHEVLGEGFRSREEIDLKFVQRVKKREAEEAAREAAQQAFQAELAAKAAAEKAAQMALDIKKQPPTDEGQAQNHLLEAEQKAEEAAQAAKAAYEHALELTNEASSIEDCVSLNEMPQIKL
jgi:uncharacterized membrane-anchored protein YitT (DUF2179 family)